MPPRFRVYYDDDSTYTGDPYYAPRVGVQVVVQETPGGKEPFRVMKGKDGHFYWKPESGWHRCDTPGMWDYWFHYRGPQVVIFGREMEHDEEYQALVRRAKREGLG